MLLFDVDVIKTKKAYATTERPPTGATQTRAKAKTRAMGRTMDAAKAKAKVTSNKE